MSALIDDVRSLLARATQTLPPDSADEVGRIASRLDEPLRVAFAGRVKAGKSTLLNALVGEEIAPTDASECTRLVTWYQNGRTYGAKAVMSDGTEQTVPFTRADGSLSVDLGGVSFDDINRIEVTWPSRRLDDVTLIDTPGLGSAITEHSAPTERFLSLGEIDDQSPSDADAVIYLMRHMHTTDLSFLEAFHDGGLGGANPVNTIAVLSRADEVGACRPEAMQTARRIAGRYRSDDRLRRLCRTVVPISGLVAQASVTLTESEYRSLAALATLPRDEMDALLLTVDRFVTTEPAPITAVERQDLLERLGLYGVRIALRLIRHGAADSASDLAVQLREMSGIDELRNLLTGLFGARRDLLKARAALNGLDAILRHEVGPEAQDLATELERLVASAHEFTELRILDAARSGAVPLTTDDIAEIEQLMDRPDATLAERLGVATGDEHEELVAAIERWRRRAEHPLSNRAVVDTATAVVRSLEGCLVEVGS